VRVVDAAAAERIAIGAGILGTGGGGNPYLGKLQAQQFLKDGCVPLVPVDELPDDALVVSVGGIGAPVVSQERLRQGQEELMALRALERHLGRAVTHLISGEIGGANALRPIATAAQTGLPLVDGDGMGRAFPELQMDTFSIYGIPPSPTALADPRGHIAIFDHIDDPHTMERYARAVTIQMGGAAGNASNVMSGAEARRVVVPGTMTLAATLGEAVLAARRSHTDPIDAIFTVVGGQRLFTGKIVDVNRRLEGGFARGSITLAGADAATGAVVDFQNENLIARRDDGTILATVPDLICVVDTATGEPVTTELLRYGLRVTVIGIPAHPLLRTSAALDVVGPAAFGYDLPYVPLPGVSSRPGS